MERVSRMECKKGGGGIQQCKDRGSRREGKKEEQEWNVKKSELGGCKRGGT
jgi:hypothetical protein